MNYYDVRISEEDRQKLAEAVEAWQRVLANAGVVVEGRRDGPCGCPACVNQRAMIAAIEDRT